MKKLSFLLIFLFIAYCSAVAQTAANYTYVRTSGTATNIAGASGTTSTTGLSDDDATQTNIPIGFSFSFCGATYTSLAACSNGFISLSNGSAHPYSNTADNIPGPGMLMPFWDDLDGSNASGTAYYQTSGTAPNRVFKFQWGSTGALRWSNLTGSGRAIFQIDLYESSNVIQFIYGNGNFSGNSATIGIANSTTDFRTITSAGATASVTTFSTAVAGSPANGSIMTWTAEPTIAVNPASLTFTTNVSTTTTGQNVTVSAYGLTSGSVTVTAPANFQIYNGTAWVTTMTLTTVAAAVGTYVNSVIPVRFVGPATVGTYTGNITCTSTGATTKTIALTGNVANPCSGTPVAGTATITPTFGGSGTPFSVSLSGYTVATGITFQWQSSTDASTWTNITGATNDNYSFTGITATKYYRCNVTCAASSTTTASTQCSAIFIPSACTPSYFDAPATSERLNNFSLTGYSGSTINDNGPSTHPSSGYEDRTTAVTPVNLRQGDTYSGSVTYTPADYYYENQIFIDFNNNGTFEASENVTPVFGTGGCSSTVSTDAFTINIALTAATGYHRMRIRNAWTISCTNSTAMDPCNDYDADNDYYYGTTRDYVVNILPAPACSGTPVAGTISATTTNSCTGYSPTLTLTGSSLNSGLTYQWQSSPDNSTWTSVSGATNTTYIPTINTAIYYRCNVTCTGSGITSSTPGVSFTVTNCYNMTFGGTTSLTTCGVILYDDGGASGNYGCCSANSTVTIYPGTPGSKVTVHFNSLVVETCCDWLRIFDGNSTSATLIGEYTAVPADITSTAADGSLTFRLHSDVSLTYSGFEAVIGNTNPNPITAQPASNTATCLNATTSISITATGTNTYQWYNNGTTNANTGGTLIAGATNATYSPTTASLGTIYYYCVVNNACNVPFSSTTAAVLVNPLPAAISGTATVCPGLTTTFNDATAGGTWISGSTGTATIGSTTGIATGVAAGNAVITYQLTATGCQSTTTLTVNPLPAAISGTAAVCVNSSTTLSSSPAGGTWSSGTTSIGTINSTSGVLSGISSGLTIITYTLPTTCINTVVASVNPLPALTVTPSSPATVCLGDNATFTADAPVDPFTLLAQDFNSGLGTWTITNTTGVAASYWQLAAPGYFSTTGDGTQLLQAASQESYPSSTNTTLTSPSFSTVTYGSATLSFNQFLLSQADLAVDVQYSINGGTTWTTLLSQADVISGSGAWVASSPEVSIALPSAALGQPDVKLRWYYNASSYVWLIDNIKVSAMLPPATYAWTGAAGLSCTACATSTITPTAAGANAYTVTATTSAGCTATTGITVSVNPVPATITGTQIICEGATTVLATTSTGGTWTSGSVAIATINATDGTVTGVAAGTAVITYTLPTGCRATATVTVNATPAPITGPSSVCFGLSATLGETFTTGNWTTTDAAIAPVSATGVISGNTVGNVVISYTIPATGCYATKAIAVNPLPGAISGNLSVCEYATTLLSDGDMGGTWSSSSVANATADPATGVVTGVAAGNATITYTLPTGCIATATATVIPAPAPLTGAPQVCTGSTTVLIEVTGGGTWSSSNAAIAPVSISGIVSGLAEGTATITYIVPSGCLVTQQVTVNALPDAITGITTLCANTTSPLADATTGGLWSSSDITVAGVDAAGIVSGITGGYTIITYTTGGNCIATASVTINAAPAAITGPSHVCEASQITVENTTPGGDWSTGNGTTAVVDPSGIVTGYSAGITDITYTTNQGCNAAYTVTVDPRPADITGTDNVCENATIQLNTASAGGNWSSGNTAIATVTATGLITGLTDGSVYITYTYPVTGCQKNQKITINPLPDLISGNAAVCLGLTTTVYNATTGGNWTSDAPAIATIDGAGIITANAAGNANIVYTLPTGCQASIQVTVNQLPQPISGIMSACVGATAALSTIPANGTWTSANASIAAIDDAGIVTGITDGIVAITYTLPTGCVQTTLFTVNPVPQAIVGNNVLCEGASSVMTSATTGGTWSSMFPLIAGAFADGTVTAFNAGNTTITYTAATGCITTKDVTVNALPAAITGNSAVCVGLTTALNTTTTGGTWSSANASVATVDATGLTTGISSGNTDITYSSAEGCITTASIMVNELPADISGPVAICKDLTATLSSTTTGGTWFSSFPAIAFVDPVNGIVTGIDAGIATITYMLPTGCITTKDITVNALPADITGTTNVCEGLTTTLNATEAGGTWSSDDVSIATVDASGTVTAIVSGQTTIAYTLPTGCLTKATIVVNQLPASLTGNAPVCQGMSIVLSSATSGGNYSSSTTSVATVAATGTVSGINAGTAAVTYALPTGCITSAVVTVNPLPATITGNTSVCMGGTSILNNATAGGTWTSGDASIVSISPSGLAIGLSAGAANITYTLPTTCISTTTFTVNDVPGAITGTLSVCAGEGITLATTSTGGTWTSSTTRATIDQDGVVIGIAAGTSTISYAFSTGCVKTAVVTVNALPELINGNSFVCEGATTALTDASGTGTWTTSSATNATVNATTGDVTGIAAGNAIITYTLPTGCARVKSITINPAAQANTGTATICNGNSTLLANSQAGGVWSSANTAVANVGAVTGIVTSATPGTATIIYTIPATGCSANTIVTVNNTPAAITGSHTICMGATATLNNTSTGGTWSADASGNVAVNAVTGIVTAVAVGNADVTYTLPAGCLVTATVTVSGLPAVNNVTGGGSYCAGGAGLEISLDNSAADVTYRLYNGATQLASATGNGSALSFGNFTTAGNYTVVGTNTAACVSNMSGSATIIITPSVIPAISVVADNNSQCAGTLINYTSGITHGGTAPVINWTVGTTVVGSGATLAYTPANGDVVTATLTSNEACASPLTATDAITMTVINGLTPAVNISAIPGNKVCQGTAVTFTASPANGGTAPTYTWIAGGITSTVTGPSFTYNPLNGDVVICKLQSNAGCLSENNVSSNAITMAVDEIRVPLVNIIADPGNYITSDQSVTFTTSVSNAGANPVYQWQVNSVVISSATGASFTAGNFNDGDSVTCIVSGGGNCDYPTINTVVMHVTPSTGVTAIPSGNVEVRLIPNPNIGRFSLTGTLGNKADESVTIEIADMLGQLIYTANVATHAGNINQQIQLGGTLANGMYILNLKTSSGTQVFHFVLKQ